MIKQEIIEKISKYFKLTHFEAEKIYDDIFHGIIQGVKEDNIADITNLGEFIIKYNNAENENKKTVEFLPSLSLEDEINQRSADEQKTISAAAVTETVKSEVNPQQVIQTVVTEQVIKTVETVNPVVEGIASVENKGDDKANIEDEIRKKRDEILNKMTTPKDEVVQAKENLVAPAIIAATTTKQVTQSIVNEIKDAKDEVKEKTTESFSDYFTEVKEEKTVIADSINKTVIPPVENVIPPTAVELHNQITGDQVYKDPNYQPTLTNTTPPYPNGNGSGNGNGNGNAEHVNQDNSYYIWYKDSEPNVTDTQTMSYEYELLYQATKEAEYKSKLRIYVTTFIMFFSIVLLLLILSPVIYKYFFTPGEDQQTEEVQETSDNNNGIEPTQQNTPSQQNNLQSTTPADQNSSQQNNTQQNTTQQNTTQQSNTPPPVTQGPANGNDQPKQEQPKQEQPKQETKQEPQKEQAPVTQNNQQQQNNQPQSSSQNNTPKIDGVTKNAMGWMDDKNRVIYVQLENGKFTIQESAWDSDAKANKRLSVVAGVVPGLKGTVVKADLGSKGVWYRTRLGEFATIEEARKKAEELRTKENMKLQALLLTFLLYA